MRCLIASFLVVICAGCAGMKPRTADALLRKEDAVTQKLYERGRTQAAIRNARETMQAVQERFGYKNSVSIRAMHELASLYARSGRGDVAESIWTEAIRLADDTPDVLEYEKALMSAGLARVCVLQGNDDQAEALYRRGAALLPRIDTLPEEVAAELVDHMRDYAALLRETDRVAAAQDLERRIDGLAAGAGKGSR